MSNLFENNDKGSILLFNVENDTELPNRKDLKRLLGIENFTYYKAHGHHRDYIHSFQRLQDCLKTEGKLGRRSFWSQVSLSHILFTSQDVESNLLFTLKYANVCRGSYFVGLDDFHELFDFLRGYDQSQEIISEISDWQQQVKNHKAVLKKENLSDRVIEDFPLNELQTLTENYGLQAVDESLAKLKLWQEQHFWKVKTTKNVMATE